MLGELHREPVREASYGPFAGYVVREEGERLEGCDGGCADELVDIGVVWGGGRS